MKVESLEFWETVKKEYDPKVHFTFCETSETFRKVWMRHDKWMGDEVIEFRPIRKLATEFLQSTNNNCDKVGIIWLFLLYSNISPKEIRINFIDWCINKFKNQ